MTVAVDEPGSVLHIDFGEAQAVELLSFDFAVSLRIGADHGIRIEQPFNFHDAASGGRWSLDPEGDPVHLAPLLVVARKPVNSLSVREDGSLHLVVADSYRLEVNADDDHEAWSMSGPGQMLLISTPGGEISEFRVAGGRAAPAT